MVDEDGWEDHRKTTRAAAVLNGESTEDGLSWLTGLKGDCGTEKPAIDDGLGCSGGAGDGDRLAFEVDVFEVGAGGYEDGVAVGCGVDAGLDGGLVSGDVDDGCGVALPGRWLRRCRGFGTRLGSAEWSPRVGDEFFATLSCAVSAQNASFGGVNLN